VAPLDGESDQLDWVGLKGWPPTLQGTCIGRVESTPSTKETDLMSHKGTVKNLRPKTMLLGSVAMVAAFMMLFSATP